jgi:hypothetical protein
VGTGLGSTIVIAGAAFLVAKLIEDISTEKGRDKLAECEDKAQQKLNDCRALENAFTFAGVEAFCLGQFLLDSAACIAS